VGNPIVKNSNKLSMSEIANLVSVCIPTYNGATYLQEALDSVKNQTYRPIEVVVSDDDSKDDTLEIVSRFRESANFPVHIHHHKPQGIGANWNNSVEMANGKFIKFLFQDDLLRPTCIEKMVQALQNNPNIGLVSCKRNIIVEDDSKNMQTSTWIETYSDLQSQFDANTDSNYLFTKDSFKHPDFFIIPRNKIGEPSIVLFKKSLFEKMGPFREDLKQALDYEYWYRILKEMDILVLNDELASFRIHGMQATNVNRNQGTKDNKIFRRILYNDYMDFLSADKKRLLRNEFHPASKLYQRIAKKIKKIFK
jgi:glycosyltransferase involved in cell wall biosynthesis